MVHFSSRARLEIFAAVCSLFNLLAFHIPFFKYVWEQALTTGQGVALTVGFLAVILVANYLVAYLLMYAGRFLGRFILSFFLIGNAVSLYFINTYDVMITDSMMGNVFNTDWNEATGFWSWTAFFYILTMGILPSVYVWARKVNYGNFKRFLANIGISLAIILTVAGANYSNMAWIHVESGNVGSLVLPWSYTVNTFRYRNVKKRQNAEEIILPDAGAIKGGKKAVVLVIGESARLDHFSLYGYERNTCPLLSAEPGLKAFRAKSSATYTIAGVKAILEHMGSDKLYEPLPNYLFRNGVNVIWRSSNSGAPQIKANLIQDIEDISTIYPGCSNKYDECLYKNLADIIEESGKNRLDEKGGDKVLVVLHTSTSHGPVYPCNYPPQFEIFSPVCRSADLAKSPLEEVINAYDNTIVYTDYVLEGVISELKNLKDWESCMIYVSDHGESLGEKGLFMHGVDMMFAPSEQYEIPFIVWTSSAKVKFGDGIQAPLSQHHVFHSVLDFLEIESPVLDKEKSIFDIQD